MNKQQCKCKYIKVPGWSGWRNSGVFLMQLFSIQIHPETWQNQINPAVTSCGWNKQAWMWCWTPFCL